MSAACVSSGKYDAAIAELIRVRDRLHASETQNKSLEQRIKDAEDATQQCQAKLTQATTDTHNVQAALDEATAMNQKMREELQRLGKDVDKMLAEKGTLSKSLDDAKARLEELRKAQAAAEARAKVLQDFLSKLKKLAEAGQLKIVTRKGRLVLQLPNDVLFDSGSANVKPAGKAALNDIATALKSVPDRAFQVSGHTDNVPIGGGAYGSNWELSTDRAVHVLKILLSDGVSAQQVSAAGYGEFDPISSNDSPDGRAKNRRIEITLQPNIEDLVAIPNVQ
jgi:chemotaxis protein MotB